MILKKFCKKLGRETLLRHFVRLDFCNFACANVNTSDVFILFSFLAFGISVNAQSIFGKSVIVLTQKNGDREPSEQVGDTSPEDAPKVRSTISQPVCASLYNKVVTIDFQTVFSTVTINIANKTTGEIVSSELFINPTSFSIDLNGKDTGDYMIEIISNEISLEGHFSL